MDVRGIDYNTLALIVLGLVNLYTAIITKQTRKDIATVEKATNSMKDALVASIAKASHAEGLAEGKAFEPKEN